MTPYEQHQIIIYIARIYQGTQIYKMASLLPVRISEDKNYRLCRVILVAIHKIFYTVIVLCLLDGLSLYTAFMPFSSILEPTSSENSLGSDSPRLVNVY